MKFNMIKHIKDNTYECSCGLHFKKIGGATRCKKCSVLNNQFIMNNNLETRSQKKDIDEFITLIGKFCENKERGCLTH